jgi:hypothetical protein
LVANGEGARVGREYYLVKWQIEGAGDGEVFTRAASAASKPLRRPPVVPGEPFIEHGEIGGDEILHREIAVYIAPVRRGVIPKDLKIVSYSTAQQFALGFSTKRSSCSSRIAKMVRRRDS